MDVKITNIYNNEALPGKGLKSGHGECFHIAMGDKQILLDTGWKGGKLLHNMKRLGIDADYIDKLVLSHGHRDHTGGLKSFLGVRPVQKPVQIFAHPSAMEPKSAKIFLFHISMGLPKLSRELTKKAEFHLTKDSVEVLPNLVTTGEIPIAERLEKPGIVTGAFHKVNGRREWDPVIDDLSLILEAKDGLVLVTGCCHAGLLNTCARATRLFNGRIIAILGGTHMVEYSQEDVDHVGEVLEKVYGTPELYLNHCTGKDAIGRLRGKFGSEVVHDCHVGTEVVFKI
ncbi:MAG: MBL fold metallo-hydrolase [Candidatus Bathyarchaeia archaeon]|jgi:7,8-dihydropterin-6-yl-methyl-4-(beta-D-ribofuranosyl)aminobenzene 5'-phosphate synthase